MSYEQTLHRVLELQGKIKEVHPLFGNSYPIAIVEGDTFLVFDIDDAGHAYHLVRQAPTPMPIPVGVRTPQEWAYRRAAFELECYDNKIACVVTGEVFDTLDGYVTIFHEFVHCHQSSTCELKLKQNLQVARQAMASGNFMWEIEHLFPYSSLEFTETYTALLHAVEANAGAEVLSAHRRLVKFLQPVDFEYLVWQEWKEGFARLLENRLQRWFGLPENHYGRQQPYHRITFYEGGARLIDALSQDTPELTCGRPKSGLTGDLEKLFWRIQHA